MQQSSSFFSYIELAIATLNHRLSKLYGRRSERKRKKALRRFLNLQNDPQVIEDDVQAPEVEIEDQANDIDEGVDVQHEPELPTTILIKILRLKMTPMNITTKMEIIT
ncbi:hypothetical protein L1887_14617 [Cichorium endivia]|nr:hypothetical protein L1887_14617 [Cichorium endivia]